MKRMIECAILLALAVPVMGLGNDKKAPAKVIDPICGMTVDPKTSEKAVYKGKTYYFCSRDEKASFEKSPEKYVKGKK